MVSKNRWICVALLYLACFLQSTTCGWGFSPLVCIPQTIATPMTTKNVFTKNPLTRATVPQHRTATSTTSLAMGKAVVTKTTLAGKLIPFVSNMFLGQSSVSTVWASLVHAVDLREFAAISTIAWGTMPLVKNMYEKHYSSKGIENPPLFKTTFWYTWATNLSQAAKLGALIYAVDCLAVILNSMGFKYVQTVGFSHKAANISIFVWLAMRLKVLKKYLLRKAFVGKSDGGGGVTKARVFDQVSDAVLYIVTACVIIDRLNLNFGATLSSFFAFGGIGTLVFSLASRDLATQLVSGLSVKGSNTFSVGDVIKLGDGTSGIVSKIGLLYTELRGGDEIITRIPNSQISNQRISNISRADKSQVKQTLWFAYEDIEKLPNVIRAIKREIQASCPYLITDGSRPFRVSWSTYESDHLEVEVDCRFNHPPKGGVYYDTMQAVLEAIARAVRKEDVEFALPSYVAKNVDLANTRLRFNKEDSTFSVVPVDETEKE